MRGATVAALAAGLLLAAPALADDDWRQWLDGFGTDQYRFPEWVREQMGRCTCTRSGDTLRCTDPVQPPSGEMTYCAAKQWLIDRMPGFDKHYLPPSASVDGASMLDDNIAFTLMALNATRGWGAAVPLPIRMAYVLPYAAMHEARQNWRPLFFAKYFPIVAGAASVADAVAALAGPGSQAFLNWTGAPPAGGAVGGGAGATYGVVWHSSTNPPVVAPFDAVAYGYTSCTGMATMMAYALRAVGVPARQVGTPCWNGGDFGGLAADNPNVSQCWNGGDGRGRVGGGFLYNHNWVEFWNADKARWEFINEPASAPNTGWMCGGFSYDKGCCPSGDRAGAAGRDHELFAFTFARDGDVPEEMDGGAVVDAAALRLSSGEAVSPLPWAPRLASPLGDPLHHDGLRMVNRSDFYRCRA